MSSRKLVLMGILTCVVSIAHAEGQTIRLDVDATRTPERIIRTHEHIYASPGELTLAYPLWYPGEHAATGDTTHLSDMYFRSNGQLLPWRRDLVNLNSFHVSVPQGADSVDIDLVYFVPQDSGSSRMLMLRWNTVLLYSEADSIEQVEVSSHLIMPDGWQYASALPVASQAAGDVTFKPASLAALVDSPVLTGQYMKKIPLTSPGGQSHEIDVATESPDNLPHDAAILAKYSNLIAQAYKLFGPGHYRDYHFLVMAGDFTNSGGGFEHHESSDDHVFSDFFNDADAQRETAWLLPHEFAHSWNGKYRRPAGMYTSSYQVPEKTDLLWVYEGATQYLGYVLAARSGFWPSATMHDFWASEASNLYTEVGRNWRPLQDTADAAPAFFPALVGRGIPWASSERGLDYYQEGAFVWLEVDTIIRQQTGGRRSLDDFFMAFYGGPEREPAVRTYTAADIFAALNSVAAYDWSDFFKKRLHETATAPPLGALERTGWRLVYNSLPNSYKPPQDGIRGLALATIGAGVANNGRLTNILEDGLAFKAGLFPGATIETINDEKWSAEAFVRTVQAQKPLKLTFSYDDVQRTTTVPYQQGLRYPHLERIPNTPDLLTAMMAPR